MSGGKANIQSLPVGEMWDVSVSKLERGGEVQYSVSGERKVSTVVKLENYPSLTGLLLLCGKSEENIQYRYNKIS